MVEDAFPAELNLAGFQIFNLVLSASWIIKIVLVILLFLSVVSWAIIFYKYRFFKREKRSTQRFLQFFGKESHIREIQREAEKFPESSLAVLFLEGYQKLIRITGDHPSGDEKSLKKIERSMRSTIQEEISHQEGYLSFLATAGNVSPFVGLFGTVLGIINAFQEIARQQTASIAAVAPGLAEALIATAFGLFAAIPAVVGYNIFLNQIRVSSSQMEAFSLELRDFFEEQMARGKILKVKG